MARKRAYDSIFTLSRTVTSVGASGSGTITAGAKGVFFRCTAGTATIMPNGGGTVSLSATGQAVYDYDYLPEGFGHGEIDYATAAASALEITEDR